MRYATCAQLVNELVEAADERRLSRLVARYSRLDLLCVDELGYVALDARGAELLFQGHCCIDRSLRIPARLRVRNRRIAPTEMDHLAGFAHLSNAARRSRIVLFAPNATVPAASWGDVFSAPTGPHDDRGHRRVGQPNRIRSQLTNAPRPDDCGRCRSVLRPCVTRSWVYFRWRRSRAQSRRRRSTRRRSRARGIPRGSRRPQAPGWGVWSRRRGRRPSRRHRR